MEWFQKCSLFHCPPYLYTGGYKITGNVTFVNGSAFMSPPSARLKEKKKGLLKKKVVYMQHSLRADETGLKGAQSAGKIQNSHITFTLMRLPRFIVPGGFGRNSSGFDPVEYKCCVAFYGLILQTLLVCFYRFKA